MDAIEAAAFSDEMTKIAGELQGHVRAGRRPFHVATLLDREEKFAVNPGEGVTAALNKADDDTAKQASAAPAKSSLKRLGGTMLAGGLVTEALRRANEDRKLGKQVRTQNQGY